MAGLNGGRSVLMGFLASRPVVGFGLPVALQGRWEGSSTFVFDYDEVANINCYHFRLTFIHDDVSIDLSEKTVLVEVTFQGKSVGH